LTFALKADVDTGEPVLLAPWQINGRDAFEY
jgi:hypothetical protein